MPRNPRILVAGLALTLMLAGCTTVKSLWPFGGRAEPAPTPVHELVVQQAGGTAAPVLQFWERNTLVVDLTGVPAEGALQLVRQPESAWPMRIAFRMAPGRFGRLEVRGAQRVAWPVSAEGAGPVTVDLPAAAVDSATPQIDVRWGAAGF